MILFSWGEEKETTPEFPNLGLRGWRWVFEAVCEKKYIGVCVNHQVIFFEKKILNGAQNVSILDCI